ncbi:MAG: ATP-dependent DNA helicase RecQ [Spirochaetales bacterium]|nr:ATP-dependent DNA helicase RecQ [Spirochaetales bacterium]
MDTEFSDYIDDAAKNNFGIRCLKPNQKLLIEKIISYEESSKEENLLAILSTGFGKSICFLLPAFLSKGISLLIFPVIALINDQSDKLRKLNIPFVTLKGGMSPDEKMSAYRMLEERKAKIIITNPEMLSSQSVISHLKGLSFSYLVLDEAHTVISWGETFRPAYLNIPTVIKSLRPKAILAFSATCDEVTIDKLKSTIFTSEPYVFISSADRENINYRRIMSLLPFHDAKKLLENENSRRAIIYCGTRARCEEASSFLSTFYPTRYYHAGLEKKEREDVEEWFRTTKGAVLAATNAFGLGIDSKGVRTVIHLYLPQNSQDFLQEAGRAGRDGYESTSYVLLNPYDQSPLYRIFTTDGCIRGRLLQTLGREHVEACFGCDGCDGKYTKGYGEELIKKAIGRAYFHSRKKIIRRIMRRKDINYRQATSALERAVGFGLAIKRFNRYRWKAK